MPVKENDRGEIGTKIERSLRKYCRDHADDYTTSTELAEAAALEHDAYLDGTDHQIPEKVFEIAADAKEGSQD